MDMDSSLSSRWSEVGSASGRPHRVMSRNRDRSRATFRDTPWYEVQRRMPMPMDAILRGPIHTPGRPSARPAASPK